MARTSPRTRSRVAYLTVGLIVAVVVATALAQTSGGRHLLRRAGLSAPSEAYTALSFAHPSAIAGATASGVGRTPVTFVVDNAGHRTTDYHWTIRVAPGGATVTGSVTVAVGRHATVRRAIDVGCPAPRRRPRRRAATGGRRSTAGGRRRVDVSLTGTPDTIGYWVTCEH